MMYFLDIFLLFLHLAVILFCLFGLFFKFFRRLHLIFMVLIAFSWFGLGIFYGLGYCPFTDWHWQIKYSLGYKNLPNSYVQYLLTNYAGLSLQDTTVDIITLVAYIILLSFSIFINIMQNQAGRTIPSPK